MKPSSEIVILGGGVCGLYAALTAESLGAKPHIIEKAKTLGGLAAGHKFGENWYDFGVHMLHAFDEEVFLDCAESMGDERIEVPLKSHIKWGGKIYHYPLRGRDILSGIPPFTLARCILGLMLAELRSRFSKQTKGANAETALIELYGEPLYEFFFEQFTHRYWGIHPRHLDEEFIRRKMPRLSAVDVFKNALEKLRLAKTRDSQEGAMRFETLHYSATGAEAMPRLLGETLESKGVSIFKNETVLEISHQDGSVKTIKTSRQTISGDYFISTIPLPELINKLSPSPPAEVLKAAEKLRFKPMIVYAILVRKKRCMDALYTYYRDRIFHRVGEPKNAGLKVTPADHTTLIVEATCEIGDDKWEGRALKQVLADLSAEGLCDPDEIVEYHLISSKNAYPVFLKGFKEHYTIVMDYLEQIKNLKTTGRQGAFTYPNMHSAMRMGADAVKHFLEKK